MPRPRILHHPHHPHHPHDPPPPPPHHHHPHPGEHWLLNVDETRSFREIAPKLARLFDDLAEDGRAELGEHIVAPAPDVDVVLRLATSPRGRKLLLVLAWDDDEEMSPTTSSFDSLFPKASQPA